MPTYKKYITVLPEDIDERHHVNNIRYVQWVQDVAQDHWIDKTSTKQRDTYYWVMISHCIQYKAEAILGDELRLETYAIQSGAVRSTRTVEIYNKKTNKLLTTSETVWCLMSHITKRPSRITEEILNLF